jgi:multiple sugar transport system substrate-binding protein
MTRARRADRKAAAVVALALAAGSLAACGGGSSSSTVTLDYYVIPTPPAYQKVAKKCAQQSDGAYRIRIHKLPADADGQREQLVRRLAAADSTMDIMGMDITWTAEMAEAGWIAPWPKDMAKKVTDGTLDSAVDTATWKGTVYGAPYVTNLQLLWYRSDLVDKPPKTWDEMIDMAEKLAKEGKPHYIEIQGAQYEGATVWFNSLVHSAGGSILNKDGTKPSLGKPALKALKVMHRLATSPAADPSLPNQMEDQNRLAMEGGRAAFELNWPYVWPSMQSNDPVVNGVHIADHFKWALYPSVTPGEKVHTTTGGVNFTISAFSKHKRLAFQAAACMRDRDNQLLTAIKGGVAPTLVDLYEHPTKKFKKKFPFYQDIYSGLKSAVNRPKTPAYQSLSIVISHLVSPPGNIDPPATLQTMTSRISDTLHSQGLIP